MLSEAARCVVTRSPAAGGEYARAPVGPSGIPISGLCPGWRDRRWARSWKCGEGRPCRGPVQISLVGDTHSEIFIEPSPSIRHDSRLVGAQQRVRDSRAPGSHTVIEGHRGRLLTRLKIYVT